MANTTSYDAIVRNPGIFKELVEQVRRTEEPTILMDRNRPVVRLVSHQESTNSFRTDAKEPVRLIELVRRTRREITILDDDKESAVADLIPHREMPSLEGMPSYPVNYMTMLDTLYNNERWEGLHARFNFFAFMIHDSEAHRDFDRKIKARLLGRPGQVGNENDDFDRLYQVSAESDKLLFFALVDSSPQEDRDPNLQPDRDTQDVSEPSRSAISLAHSIASTDPTLRAVSLANSLEIPDSKLPCLVITPELYSRQFRWIRTDPDRFDEQLHELRSLAYRVHGFGNFGKERVISDCLQRISSPGENGTVSLIGERNFGSALTNVMTFTVAGNSPVPEEKNKAREIVKNKLESFGKQLSQIKISLNSFQQQLEDAKKTVITQVTGLQDHVEGSAANKLEDTRNRIDAVFEDLINKHREDFETTCETIDSLIAVLAPDTQDLELNDFKIKKEFLESDSYEKLKVAQAVLQLLADFVLRREISLDSLDYSPGVIGPVKAFEREVNLSVVHWVRKELGITLPDYFDTQQSCTEAKYILPGKKENPIDFNKKDNNSWRPPTIGQSLEVCKYKKTKGDRDMVSA